MLEGKDPFADLTKDKGDAKLNAIGTYAVLYKIYCYNKLLAQKFGKDIYLSTIIEKQREKIAAADLAISEHFVAQMRMFQELEVLKERENSEFEGLLAFTLIRREEEFSDVKDDDDFGGPLWMMKITDIFKEENKTIEEYFKLYWKNSGFNQRELESWLSQNS
ncbi:MAG: hypothetical protein EBQ96_07580 [Proteobacteria bacterium]|nr:hypothetical protein [Pseudomonadota bacterium]